MLKELKEANDLLEESLNEVDNKHPNWGIPISIILNDLKPVAEKLCNLDLNKVEKTERNSITLEITRSHLLMDQIPSNKNKS
jgi:hypothetical protein